MNEITLTIPADTPPAAAWAQVRALLATVGPGAQVRIVVAPREAGR